MPRPIRERTRLPGSILDRATHRNYNPDTPRIGGQFVSRKKHEEYQKSGIAPEQKHNPLRGPDGQYLNVAKWEQYQKARQQHGLPPPEPPVSGFTLPPGYAFRNGQLMKVMREEFVTGYEARVITHDPVDRRPRQAASRIDDIFKRR